MATKDFDYTNFDYAIYVDASGDDGQKFEKGSSLCFTTGCFITATEDIEYNLRLLNDIKTIVGCKITDELKFSSIKRHRKFSEILKIIPTLKGYFMMHNAFKKDVITEDFLYNLALNTQSKSLAAITHTFPIFGIYQCKYFENKKILIVIDVMKKVEMDNVLDIFDTQEILKKNEDNYKIIFRDSKAHGFELIQIADLIAGIFRVFFENTYYNSKEDFQFIKRCVTCQLKNSLLCTSSKNRAKRYQILRPVYPFKPLRLVKKGADKKRFSSSYYTLPIDYMDKYFRILLCDK